jgi:hypothetical protein
VALLKSADKFQLRYLKKAIKAKNVISLNSVPNQMRPASETDFKIKKANVYMDNGVMYRRFGTTVYWRVYKIIRNGS